MILIIVSFSLEGNSTPTPTPLPLLKRVLISSHRCFLDITREGLLFFEPPVSFSFAIEANLSELVLKDFDVTQEAYWARMLKLITSAVL